METETKEYIPTKFPEKCLLMGGGQFINQFMVVNVLSVKTVPHCLRAKEGETIPQATVKQNGIRGIEKFEPYLFMYHLQPLDPKYQDVPLDTYIGNFDGTATGQYTKYFIDKR